MRYCGRDFASADIHGIRQIIEAHPTATRARLSRLVCEQLDWRRDDGRLKDMSCRVAMLRMQDDRVLHLPPPRNGNNNGKPYRRRTRQAEPAALLKAASPTALGALHLQVVTDRHDSHLHNELIDRYHYLGYQPLPGAQLRYFVRANRRMVALLGFGAAAWKTQPRDLFIGWTPEQRQQRLHLVTNNARFLILPWVRCKNLASAILGMAARRLPQDWNLRYGYSPVLLETFVELPGSVAPATERQTGASWARPRAGESSTSTTRHCCRRRLSGSTHSSRTSGVFSAPDESPIRSAL